MKSCSFFCNEVSFDYIANRFIPPIMKMLRFLFLLLVITLPLAKVLQASSQVPDKSQFITAGNYRLFLAAVAEIQDAHGLYQPEMESQIICTQDVDDKNYRIIDGQEDAPMGNMTRLNAMRYCNWQEHHCPDEKEDAVAAALSTESGFYDLQNDQLVCVHPEVGDHLVDDHEGDEFFWITTEPEEQKRLPLMMFSFFDTEKEKTNQQRDRGDIEASRLRGGDDDSSAGVQRGITARIGEYSTSASERVPGVTWCEMMKTKLLEIWDYLKRFFVGGVEVRLLCQLLLMEFLNSLLLH